MIKETYMTPTGLIFGILEDSEAKFHIVRKDTNRFNTVRLNGKDAVYNSLDVARVVLETQLVPLYESPGTQLTVTDYYTKTRLERK